jgi:GlpG protein
MRLIGYLPTESSARTFADYLYVQGIDNLIEDHKGDGWGVWVKDEDKVEPAVGLLSTFRANPTDSKYQAGAKGAAQLRADAEKSEAAYRKKVTDRRHLFRPLTAYGFGPLTFVLIVISVVVAIFSKVGYDIEPVKWLFITDFDTMWDPTLPEIRHGQVWRLITPIFIHFGPLHILFNMLWLRDLGSMIEGRQSSLQLFLLVLVIAAVSNLAQCYSLGPDFGGMSGVVYGLFGYIWIRGKFDPGSGLYLHPSTVTMMIVWFFACLVGIIPHVANMAHGAGLAVGMAWGYLSSLKYR